MKTSILVFSIHLIVLSVCYAESKVADIDSLYKEAAKLLAAGEYQRSRDLIDQMPEETLRASRRVCELAAAAEAGLGNLKKASEILDVGIQAGHVELYGPIALIQLNQKNYEWLQKHEARLMREIARKTENYIVIIEVMYSWGLETCNVEILKNVISVVKDEDIVADKKLAALMLKLHRRFLVFAKEASQGKAVVEPTE